MLLSLTGTPSGNVDDVQSFLRNRYSRNHKLT